MKENSFEAEYDITKKSRLRNFYESNKILIFSFILISIVLFSSFTLYFENKKNKKILLSENYVQAKIYIDNGNKTEAINMLKEIIFANDSTYSTLCFFLILNQNLIEDYNELSDLFTHLMENNKFEKEIRNLLIYKKALFHSNFVNESELLEQIKPLLNNADSLWRPYALLLLGDYFVSKHEYLKAKEFYNQIFSIKNLPMDIYNQARSQLAFIAND